MLRTTIICALASITLASVSAQSNNPPPVYRWSTVAGRASLGMEDGPAADARFDNPHGLAMDLAGNLYVADTGNHTIRKITAVGVVSTFAGSSGQSGSADGAGSAARFNGPLDVAVDSNGNVYVADTGNHTVRKITPAGVVTTYAGQAGRSGTADGAAASALFIGPDNLTADANGNLYLWDNGVRKISGGNVRTLTIPTQATDWDGETTAVSLSGLGIDAAGQLYFQAAASRWLYGAQFRTVRLDSMGNLTILDNRYSESNHWPSSISSDVSGNLYVTIDYSGWGGTAGTTWGSRMTPDGALSGSATNFISHLGNLANPRGYAVDQAGHWYYTRADDDAIIRDGVAFAGTPCANPGIDGTAATARFADARALAVDLVGNVWVAEYDFNAAAGDYGAASFSLRKATANGDVSTVIPAHFQWERSMEMPSLAADGAGNILFSRSLPPTYLLSQITPSGTTIDLPNDPGQLLQPRAMAANPAGSILATSYGTKVYRRYADGTWRPIAGGADSTTMQDGSGASARFSALSAITTDRQGDFYVVDSWGHSPSAGTWDASYVRKVSADGMVTTVTGNLLKRPTNLPSDSLAVDSHGALFVIDSGISSVDTWLIRRFGPNGESAVIGGAAEGSKDGVGDAARFATPASLVVDAHDNLYLIDDYGTTVRKGEFLGYTPGISAQPQSATVPAGGSVQFAVSATATPAPTYQWYFGGSAIGGAIDRTLALSNVQASAAGDYTVVVTNAAGSITSARATLTVTSATAPAPAASGGGGGSVGAWLVLSLAALGTARISRSGFGRCR